MAAITITEIPGQRLIDGADINTIISVVNGLAAGTTAGVYTGTFNGSVGATTPSTGVFTAISDAGALTFTAATSGIVLKRGSNGKCGTFICNGATPVTVANTGIAITDAIIVSLNTVGGTVGAIPAIQTITAATGFTIAGTASDTSTYNYAIISNAA